MTKKVALLLATVLCIHQYAFSQKARDYIATDTTLAFGVKLEPSLPRFNSQYITMKIKNGVRKYTPDEIKEYGFKDGTVFETQQIRLESQERKVFLERIVKGTITLYLYVDSEHKTYFIKEDSAELVELGKDLEAIRSVSQDCGFMSDAIRLASYKRKSLQKLVSHYNTCEKKPFPFKKFGVLAGWRQLTLAQPSGFAYAIISDISIPSSGSPMVGMFADLPIEMSEFSLHPELFFTTNNFASNVNNAQSDLDILIHLSTLQAPVLARYTVPTSTWRPFVNAGPYFAYNIENSSDIYFAEKDNNTVTIERPLQDGLVADFMFGYSVGTGLQRKLDFRKTLSAEVRYTWATGPDNSTLIQSGIDLIMAFTF